jgi:hypothetical protein
MITVERGEPCQFIEYYRKNIIILITFADDDKKRIIIGYLAKHLTLTISVNRKGLK